ncbi:hypothetical protein E8E14_007054 [Neopestalotiopsis sp. 37M]|nr:hypothetical protein E8E14_007054 [Neopestalotiopsis sp. 37M]
MAESSKAKKAEAAIQTMADKSEDLSQQLRAQQSKADTEQRKLEDLQKKSDNIEHSNCSTATPILPPRTEVNITETIIWYKLVDDNACSPAEKVLIADLRAIATILQHNCAVLLRRRL